MEQLSSLNHCLNDPDLGLFSYVNRETGDVKTFDTPRIRGKKHRKFKRLPYRYELEDYGRDLRAFCDEVAIDIPPNCSPSRYLRDMDLYDSFRSFQYDLIVDRLRQWLKDHEIPFADA